MKNESASPEERLFKIIQEEKRSAPVQGSPDRPSGPGGASKAAGEKLAAWKKKLTSLAEENIEKVKRVFSGKAKEVKLETINRALFVVLVLLAASAFYYAIARYPNTARMINAAVKAQGAMSSAPAQIEELKQASYYTGEAARRDIFSAKYTAPSAGMEGSDLPAVKSSSGDLRLQGIVWSDVPKAIIHSDKDNRMYVVKEGQAVGFGGIKVKKIQKNKVLLTDGERDFEL